MSLVQNVPSWSILLLIICGVVSAALPRNAARILSWVSSLVVGCLNLWLLCWFIAGGNEFTYSMGHYGAPFGNELKAGALEAGMATLFCFVMFLSLIGGHSHINHDVPDKKGNLYYISTTFLLCSMLALVYTNDLFTAYVFIEINTITACGIVASKDDKKALAASIRYLVMSLIGSGLFLLGICIMYGATGHLLMEPIREFVLALDPDSKTRLAVNVAIALFAVGMALKSAMWPFHNWLPEAHSNATATSSALLSGLVLKAYIFLLLKVIYRVLGIEILSGHAIFDILLIFGAGAMIMGSIHALREKDLKRMLAFSSVGQIGCIYLAIGMGTESGFHAAAIQILVHAATKAMLFISSGGIMDVSGGSKKFKDIKGAGKRDPLAGFAFVCGSFSMIGIPFFAGFVTKYSLVSAAVHLGTWQMCLSIFAIVVSTVLTAIYYLMAIAVLFGGDEKFAKFDIKNYHYGYVISIIIFIALNIFIGLNTDWLINLVNMGFAMFA